jgi:ABC-2 type transport system ATP-binding protein
VVLGLIFAQNPELMILDDYSMGLDAGYRRLFLEYLDAFIAEGDKTVFVTSHVVQDMEDLVDEVIFLQRGGTALQMPLARFREKFRRFVYKAGETAALPVPDELIRGIDHYGRQRFIYSFMPREQLSAHLLQNWPDVSLGEELPMSLEDAFIGLTGKY